ncbi:AraC family transcriptional regulator [Reichenbachiella ulvae]|uniref:AraC family transcriptional regulator n=1 Tax=Reichenbachiella ulvae TaxID=2980104 RepID=A0ABT3CQ54_9BACT|nr:AraC family transcriptional regulator [Reichenbachiella ulvae]MCV9385848.1 AraC family transcriptional regulator [Reichenbachiella ulvae]
MKKFLIDSFPTRDERSLFTLVENRTAYSYDMCELNLFETHRQAENVNLMFDHFVLTSMLSGKKVMKLPEKPSFDYYPGESVILPPGEMMSIDFPEAKKHNPTQCIALTISNEAIVKTVDVLNEVHPKAQTWGQWNIDPSIFHLTNNMELSDTINRIIRITKSEQGKAKDLMVELTLREMLIRLMQTQARVVFEKSYALLSSSNALAHTLHYIKNNLRTKIDMNKLADQACMSRASFFKKFKETMGITPSQYIQKARIHLAQEHLKAGSTSISKACYASGFENLSHFTKSFKQEVGMTPKEWQLQYA